MDSNGAFDNLVSGLDKDEKNKLLEKLKMQSVLSEEPLIDPKQNEPQQNTDSAYTKLPWYMRLWYWILGILTGKPPVEAFLNNLIATSGRQISLLYPGMYDYQKSYLKESFKLEVNNLKEAARFFYTLLDASVARDKGAFISYLASLTVPETHEALVESTDPNMLTMQYPDTSDSRLRSMALDSIDREMGKITQAAHDAIYSDIRTLNCLKELSSFLYDRLIMSFNDSHTEDGVICPFSIVRAQLIGLDNILFSMKKTPSMDLLSALFVFSMQEYTNDPHYDEDRELQKYIQKAEKSIAVIRSFNRRVPLTAIIRCALRNMGWNPDELPGGEDWFATYKNYWFNTTRERFADWILTRRQNTLNESLQRYFGDIQMFPLEYAYSEEKPDGIPIAGALPLSFLLTFHKKVFMPDINVIIRPILIDGEFYKRENRTEFTESYNVLIKLDDSIKEFDVSLSPAGDRGKLWAQIITDVQSVTVRKRKLNTILEDLGVEVDNIISGAYNALDSMEKVLSGIASGSLGTQYDTLSNIAKIQGKGTQFMDGLHQAIEKIYQTIRVLDNMKAVQAASE